MDRATDRAEELRRIGTALHDLCQPMTTLQCRLELATMIGTPEAHREAVESGLEQCGRLAKAVVSMRDVVREALEGEIASGVGR